MIGEILTMLGVGLGLTMYDESKKKKQHANSISKKQIQNNQKQKYQKQSANHKMDYEIEAFLEQIDVGRISQIDYYKLLTLYYLRYENQVFQESTLQTIQNNLNNKVDIIEIKRDLKRTRAALAEGIEPWNYSPDVEREMRDAKNKYYYLLVQYLDKYKDQVFQEVHLQEIRRKSGYDIGLAEIKRDLKKVRDGNNKSEHVKNDKDDVSDEEQKLNDASKIPWDGEVCVGSYIDDYVESLYRMDYVIDKLVVNDTTKNEFVQRFLSEKVDLIYYLDFWKDSQYKAFRFISIQNNNIFFQKIILEMAIMLEVGLFQEDNYQKVHLRIYSAEVPDGETYIMDRSFGYSMDSDSWSMFTIALNMYRLGQVGDTKTLQEIAEPLVKINVDGWIKE